MAAQENGSELQGYLLSPILFNIFLERIMCEALDDHEGSVSIGGWLITNFRFADDTVVNAEEEEDADIIVDRIQPPQSTKWRSVQTRQKWWQTTKMASKERSR